LEYIRAHNLSGAEAEAAINEEARETLATVNLYLGAVADAIKRHNGTLDKYIGDCAMAFWNAPLPNPKHAAGCVRAAIDASALFTKINLKRAGENQKRELENVMLHGGTRPKSRLPILTLGSGINTGMVTVGLMGSTEHLLNYTVFGREVNLASRLESASGSSRIIISEATYEHLRRDDPELAATCVAQPPVKVRGIVAEVKIYEVPWRPPGASPFDEELSSGRPRREQRSPASSSARAVTLASLSSWSSSDFSCEEEEMGFCQNKSWKVSAKGVKPNRRRRRNVET